MGYVLIGIAYVLFLGFFVKFFQGVHQWDEEIRSMEIKGKV